ncbi:MAG: SDR family oxidoreductase [Anaerolineae bacterium]|jgi:dihydroflavonol-4-reductase|nr:SDR family oxidoreductase [Anaerolineae bacterium]
MKALVTGATGFIGSRVARALLKAGHSVRALHRPTSSLRMLDGLPVELVVGDLTNPASLDAAAAGMDVVFHTAAMLSGSRGDLKRMTAVTVAGTRAVLMAARQAGVKRVVHTSTVSALGIPDALEASGLMDENHTWNYKPERWVYGYTKYLAELEVQRAVAAGLDVVIVNPSLVFGPGDVYRMTASLVVQVANGRLPVCTAGGLNVVHIDDVVAGHLAAMERGKTGERYILGGQNVSLPWLVKQIAAIAGTPAPLPLPAGLVRALAGAAQVAQPFVPLSLDILYLAGYYFYYDVGKAQRELRLPAPRPALDAIQDAYDWFCEMGAITRRKCDDAPEDKGEKKDRRPPGEGD